MKKHRSRNLAIFSSMICIGCASSIPSNEGSAPVSYSQITPPRKMTSTELAQSYILPEKCMAAAKVLQEKSHDDGWALAKACAMKDKFIQIRLLIDDPWVEDLQNRPDAGRLLARIIAARGGSIASDLELLRQKKLPVYSLSTAGAQPSLFVGRNVIFRAKTGQPQMDGYKQTMSMWELGLRVGKSEREPSTSIQYSATRSTSGKYSYNTDNYGSGTGTVDVQSSGSRTIKEIETRYENVVEETGVEVLVHFEKPDPHLISGMDVVVLCRFDGTRIVAVGEAGTKIIPVVTMIESFKPASVATY